MPASPWAASPLSLLCSSPPCLASRRVGSRRGGRLPGAGARLSARRGAAGRGGGAVLPPRALRSPAPRPGDPGAPKFPRRLQTTLLFAEVCVPPPGCGRAAAGPAAPGPAGPGGGWGAPAPGRPRGGGAGPAGRGARARLRTWREGPCCTGAARLPLVPAPDSPAGGSPLPAGAACRRGWARGARRGQDPELSCAPGRPGARARRPGGRCRPAAARAPLLGPGAPGAPWARAAGVRPRGSLARTALRPTANKERRFAALDEWDSASYRPRSEPSCAAARGPGGGGAAPRAPDPDPDPDPDPGAGPGRRRRRRRRARLAAAGADGAGPTAVEREQTFAGLLHGGDKGRPVPAAAGSGPHCLLAREPASVAHSQVTHQRVLPALPAGWKGPPCSRSWAGEGGRPGAGLAGRMEAADPGMSRT
ncbi:uncharacterized protein [Vulpes vulpes]|uniref:Collagen alpha-1(I) chain-like n=1 Tax=Vulpes vulpes TaxID=9627 RepID=A0ABM4Z1N2_VULVU